MEGEPFEQRLLAAGQGERQAGAEQGAASRIQAHARWSRALGSATTRPGEAQRELIRFRGARAGVPRSPARRVGAQRTDLSAHLHRPPPHAPERRSAETAGGSGSRSGRISRRAPHRIPSGLRDVLDGQRIERRRREPRRERLSRQRRSAEQRRELRGDAARQIHPRGARLGPGGGQGRSGHTERPAGGRARRGNLHHALQRIGAQTQRGFPRRLPPHLGAPGRGCQDEHGRKGPKRATAASPALGGGLAIRHQGHEPGKQGAQVPHPGIEQHPDCPPRRT
jgi:hypothetical protein